MRILNLFLLVFVSLLLAACVTAPVRQAIDTPFTAGSEKLSLDQIETVIKRAAAARKWEVTSQGPGALVAVYSPRSHMAKVAIHFDQKTFSITYLDSVNLDYTGGTIHPNYNRWIGNLQQDISRAVTAAIAAQP
jgi:hypothetical protein